MKNLQTVGQLTEWTGDLQPLLPALSEPPQAQQSLEQIVGDDEALDVVRITILHEPEGEIFILINILNVADILPTKVRQFYK